MNHKYTVLGTPRVEAEYSDDYETVMVIDIRRDDGETGDVWIVAGVRDYNRASSDAARTQYGYQSVRVFGDSIDTWCAASLQEADEDGGYSTLAEEIVSACVPSALLTHRNSLALSSRSRV